VRHGLLHVSTLFLAIAAVPFVIVLVTPVVAIFLRVLQSGVVWDVIARPIVVEALRLSALTTTISLLLALLFGTPWHICWHDTRFGARSCWTA
jgi:ABC-type sulfate transport system permease component